MLKGQGSSEAPPDELEGDSGLRTHKFATDDASTAQAAASKGRDVADDMRRNLNDQFSPQGVQITDVIITVHRRAAARPE